MAGSTSDHDSERLGALFKACDLDGSGFIDQHELARVCTELSTDDLREVFSELDRDGDGRISVEEFAKGFREIAEAMETRNREKIRSRLRSDSKSKSTDSVDEAGGGEVGGGEVEEYVGGLDEGLGALSW
ncbi:hypothetical protein BaRGS_00033502 [Batillaria attramentaria]|uniref:EF-hand domain-containing protein n=1 Tax=Batillaria attramentaria TaxID=370345 RepID=A0ABD0JJZ0_9CAEN